MKGHEGGHVAAYEGYSFASDEGEAPKTASLDEAIANAAASARLEDADGQWFEVVRVQAKLLPHNQWVKAYKVVITPTG